MSKQVPTREEIWDAFVEKHHLGSIHQTSAWAAFQSSIPGREKHWILTLEDAKGEISGGTLLIRQHLPFGLCWLYAPRGPLLDPADPRAMEKLLGKIAPIAHQEKAVFLRIDTPILASHFSDNPPAASQLHSAGFHPAHASYQPDWTLLLNLTQTEEAILAQMKPKGRYNIKIAQKHHISVRHIDAHSPTFQSDLDTWYKILAGTGSRDGFAIHNKKYYEKMLQLVPSKLFLAEKEKRIIGGSVVTFFAKTATYYFGASDHAYRQSMAPYLLQWEAIRYAKQHGYTTYDFLGIAPLSPPDPSHRYARISDFKLKFGGTPVQYESAKELIYKPFWYWLIRFAKRFRR